MWLAVAANSATYGALVVAQLAGMLPAPIQTVGVGVWILMCALLVVTAGFLGLALQLRDEALARARCEVPIGCLCPFGLSLRDWEVQPNPDLSGAQPNEHP
jgi:hypothetical protein